MTSLPLRVAVVGHTNTGKTSLLRTLGQDRYFGKVANAPGTTRHVEGLMLRVHDHPVLALFDTPGLEDAMGLRDYLDQLVEPGTRVDGPDRLGRFLETAAAHEHFEQEAKVVRQLLESDAGWYVVDSRDPVLAKHQDELAVLADAGRPLLPVLNFTASEHSRADTWREALRRLGLHAIVEFDTVAPPLDGETQLFGKLATLIDEAAPALNQLVLQREEDRRQRRHGAARLAADLLIDVAALRLSADTTTPAALERQSIVLHDRVRLAERATRQQLLAHYGFAPGDLAGEDWQTLEARLDMDLFQPEALKVMGLRLGTGAAAGATAGLAVDAALGGLSLGLGTLLGAAAGALWGGAQAPGLRLAGRLRGQRELSVDDAILRLLLARLLLTLRLLEARGHAALTPAVVAAAPPLPEGPLPDALTRARAHPEWSHLDGSPATGLQRGGAVESLAQAVLLALEETLTLPTPGAQAAPAPGAAAPRA